MSSPKLNRHKINTRKQNHPKVLVIILDGVGYIDPKLNLSRSLEDKNEVISSCPFSFGNAVNAAYTPSLSKLSHGSLFRTLKAHGKAVGLPSDEDMGNSEVGHNAIGAGRIFAQGAKLVNESIASGKMFLSDTWKKVVATQELVQGINTLHLCGLLSDGNVHSHIDHLFAIIRATKQNGVKKIRLHMLLDGRDVSPLSALDYVQKLNQFLTQENDATFECLVASGGGRTFVTMDRYESDWSIVERGYNAHILGQARAFPSLENAIETYRQEGNYYDQDLPPFVIVNEKSKPIGPVQNGDSFIFFNFRGDRAIEISRALTEEHFKYFNRQIFPKIKYAGMMQYDGDLKIPELYLVNPPEISGTMGESFANNNIRQFACSETQKYGHVTYFWNGNRSSKFSDSLETYVEIPSSLKPFDENPWMKSSEITDRTIEEMKKNSFDVGRINFANGDMVGHTGHFGAAVLSVGAVDLALERLMNAAIETNTILIVTADHGNADEMFEIDKKTKKVVYDKSGFPKKKTSHTLAPVPFAIFNSECLNMSIELKKDLPTAGLSNIAATVFELAGFEAPAHFDPSLIQFYAANNNNNNNSANSPVNSSQNNSTSSTSSLQNSKSLNEKILTPEKSLSLAISSISFAETIAHLRSPNGCPWDKEQTFTSLKKFMVEECYETLHAIDEFVKNPNQEMSEKFCEELGDVLLQVFLHAQIASEQKLFSIDNILNTVNNKMIERHPHVFAQAEKPKTANNVEELWIKIKESKQGTNEKENGILGKTLSKYYLPTLNFAQEISKAAWKVGFSWQTIKDIFNDCKLEMNELEHEISQEILNHERIADEIGDVVYSLANLVNFLVQKFNFDLDFDNIVRMSVQKFSTRFCEMEKIMIERGALLTVESAKKLDLEQWNSLWKAAKQRRYK